VRDEVFGLIANHEFIFDATLLEKSKSRPHLRATDHDFYKYAWYYHFKTFARREITRGDSLFVVVSELGTKRSRSTFRQAVNDVLAQCVNHRAPHVLPSGRTVVTHAFKSQTIVRGRFPGSMSETI
jgi:hypothetical protein